MGKIMLNGSQRIGIGPWNGDKWLALVNVATNL
jgi:hypothetical protein